MKKMMICIISALLLMFTCSCDKKKTSLTDSNNDIQYINMLYNICENGRICALEERAMYMDYDTMEWVPLCSMPNCTHTTGDCPAKVVGQTPMLIDNYIYYFNYTDGVNELKNGKRELYLNSKFCRISLDSSEVKDIVKFTDCQPCDYNGMLLYKNKIYFIANDRNPIEDEYGNIRTSNIGGNHFICSIDLKTGEYKNHGTIYDKNNLNETGQNTNSAVIKGIYDSKIYINYSYFENTEIRDENGRPIATDKVFEFDPETEELTLSDLPKSVNYLIDDMYIGYDNNIEKTIIFTNDKQREYDIDPGKFALLFNDKLFYTDGWCDLTDMSMHKISGEYESFWVMDYHDGYYILGLGYETLKLTEEELLALDKEG